MYWDHMNGWGWTMMIFWSLICVSLIGSMAWVALQWTRNGSNGSLPDHASATKTARELLDERLARGEIDPDEFRVRREALEPPVPAGRVG